MWVVDYLDDLESDFSVFHRVDDIYALDGPRFLRLALRIFAYDGVLAARLRAEQEDAPGVGGVGRAAPQQQPERQVSLAEMQAQHGGWIERTVSSP